MYCIKCGVRLTDGTERCPLCATPVRLPEDAQIKKANDGYSSVYPKKKENEKIPAAIFLTIVLTIVGIVSLIFCLRTYGAIRWSGYVMSGIAALYIGVVLPLWFHHPNPVVFVPVSFLAASAFLLYVCLYNHGDWFLSFAFPVVMLLGILTTTAVILFRYVNGGKLFIIGGLLAALGASSMLIEYFQHITFGTKMFSWSLYSVSTFFLVGLFLILAAIIRSLREWLERRSFL
ncbi:MAG: hypothetical protein VB049_00280 [Candidatus Pelethousia sp.]|nr:hypothetical protein [Candidatus Pelethousia sp.]